MEASRQIQGPGRRPARNLRRALGLLALAVALSGIAAAPGAGAVAGPGVLVQSGEGSPRFLSAATVSGPEAIPPRNYTLRARAGEAGEIDAHGGLPVRRLIQLTGFDPDRIGFITVPRADGSVAYLPAADFSEPPPFPEGPALVWVDANSTHFFRPATGSDDVNATDNIAVSREPLQIGVHEGAVLAVEADADHGEAGSGQPVHFSAAASGALAGERLSYAWSFGDGSAATGAEASHAFAGSGTYAVTVTVSGSDDSGGESAPLREVVGDPPRELGEGSAASPQHGKEAKPEGPDGDAPRGRGSGSGRKATAGADSGGAVPPAPESGPGGREERTDAGSPPAGPASALSSASTANAAPSGAASPPPAGVPGRARTGSETATTPVSGLLVSGRLPQPGSSSPPATAVLASAHPSAPAAAAPAGGAGVPAIVVGLAVLLGVGALLEARRNPVRPR